MTANDLCRARYPHRSRAIAQFARLELPRDVVLIELCKRAVLFLQLLLQDAVVELAQATLLVLDGTAHNIHHLFDSEEHLPSLRVTALAHRGGHV